MPERFRPRPVHVSDSFMLPVGRYDGRQHPNRSFLDLAASVNTLLDASSIPRNRVDCVVVGSQNPFAFSGVDNLAAKISGVLGISGAKALLVDTASSSGASAFEAAYMEIASGRHDNVLAIGIQKMSDASTLDATRIVAGVIDREEAEYGLTMPACGALVAKSLMAKFGMDAKDWLRFSSRLTERAQYFAARNKDAHLRFEIPAEQYLADARSGKNYLYYDPLRYYDFCPMSDGVAACLLTASPREVQVTGVGSGTDIPTIADRQTFTTFPATVIALRYALGMAGLKSLAPLEGKIHINMHDPFNGFGPINTVDLGIVPAVRLLEGLFDPALTGESGSFPVNLTGGLKGRGHPLGATGMIQIVENHRLITEGRFDAGLSHSIGGPINNNVVILLERTRHYQSRSSEPYRPQSLPKLSKMKPPGLGLEALFADKDSCTVRLVAATTRHHYQSGDPEKTLIIVSGLVGGEEQRFLFSVGPSALDTLSNLPAGEKIVLSKTGEEISINEVPIRRIYRKTREGIVVLADTAMRKLRKRREE